MSKPIVFFGSGPVAAKSLGMLVQHCTVEAVITKPRVAHHKGDVPVIRIAEKIGLPIHTVTDKQSLDTLFAGKPFTSELGILIDFGIIVSQAVIDYFPQGIINSHFSLLPEWRGADPITFSILSGQKQTGISLMFLTAGMDEGPLLGQATFDIPTGTTTPTLTETLIELSDGALRVLLPLWIAGQATAAPQDAVTLASSRTPTYSRKLAKEDSILDWKKSADVLEREIRAFIEWPKSRTVFSELAIIVTKAHVVDMQGHVGEKTIVDKTPVIFCGEKALAIDKLKPAGKQEMTGEAFLAGYKQFFIG